MNTKINKMKTKNIQLMGLIIHGECQISYVARPVGGVLEPQNSRLFQVPDIRILLYVFFVIELERDVEGIRIGGDSENDDEKEGEYAF